MGFNAKMISDGDSEGIASKISLGISDKIADVKSTTEEKKNVEEKRKPQKKTSTSVDYDALIKQTDIDYKKWCEFKHTTLVKPMQVLEEKECTGILIPVSFVQELNGLSVFNKSVSNKTIITNLIIDFLKNNSDIIEFLKKEADKEK